MNSTVFGAAGAIAGAAISPVLYVGLGLDISFGSILVGGLVGLGVALGQRSRDDGTAPIVLAVALTIAGSVLATLGTAAVLFFGPSEQDQATSADIRAVERMLASDEGMGAAIAAEMASTRAAEGAELDWPAGMSLANAVRTDDFPPEIRDAALQRAATMSDAERQVIVDGLVAELRAHAAQVDAAVTTMTASEPTPDTMVDYLLPFLGAPDLVMLVGGILLSIGVVARGPFASPNRPRPGVEHGFGMPPDRG